MAGLTPKQEEFCQQYLVDLNATQAAIRAGYASPNARTTAAKMLAKHNISDRIAELQAARGERTEITQDRVLEELGKLGFSDMRQFSSWGPKGVTWKDSDELSPEAAACVAEVSETITEGGRTRKFKLHDKKGSLELIGRHLGMWNDKLNLSTPEDAPFVVKVKGLSRGGDDSPGS